MLTNTYSAGQSFIHTTLPLTKVLLLFLTCTGLFIWESWAVLLIIGAVLLALFRIANISVGLMREAVQPAFWLLLAIFLLQTYLNSVDLAAFVVMRFIIMILSASLLTLTTKTSDMIAAIEAGLGRVLPQATAEAISLAFSLCFRFIPMVRQIFEEVRQAQQARGHSRNWRALVTPTIIRTLKSADEISDAITVRSVDTSYLSRPNKSTNS